ncbi:MAG: riboflavin synthase [Candidatus Thermoplasmatota archaeon]|nr:riboflavin synthase [Candidatus Thermoplasmatota archaeon]MCL5984354.1 riboflavin synthase [Candidatus Thermoplasmatota archaeon]
MKTVGVVDTAFSRVNLGSIAARALRDTGGSIRIQRKTVPGIKDLPVASLTLFREGADLVMALGMPGRAEYDKVCAHEASQGLIAAGLKVERPIVEVFVFEGEVENDRDLSELARRRTEEHALNAYWMLFRPEELSHRAGTGARQGFPDAGPSGSHRRKRGFGNGIAKYA